MLFDIFYFHPKKRLPTQKTMQLYPWPIFHARLYICTMGCHTSFFLFLEDEGWGRGTLSLNGGRPVLGDWRMEKTSRGRFYYFSHGVASFTRNPHYKKCMMDETTDFKSERMNRA
jgi:hypothetical protein